MKSRPTLIAAGLIALAACDGPQEDAGEVADNASGAVAGEDSIRSGPAESVGETHDDAAESANEAIEARADALEDAAEQERAEADRRADALEDQAELARGQ